MNTIAINTLCIGKSEEQAIDLAVALEGVRKQISLIGNGTLSEDQHRAVADEITHICATVGCLSSIALELSNYLESLKYWAKDAAVDICWPPLEVGLACRKLEEEMLSKLKTHGSREFDSEPANAGHKLKKVA